MNHFTCPFCAQNRDFHTFSNYFRHITIFHQNDSRFRITCDLNQTCGILYRSFSGYKAHVYRHHQSELYPLPQQSTNTISNIDLLKQHAIDNPVMLNSMDCHVDEESDTSDDDQFELTGDDEPDSNGVEEFFGMHHGEGSNEVTIEDVVRSFVLFIVQLREEFWLPKNAMNMITDYIRMLIEVVQTLLRTSATHCYASESLSDVASNMQAIRMIDLKIVESLMSDICQRFSDVTKNEYRFGQTCQELLGYDSPVEIVIGDANTNERSETAYFIPIERTLTRMLSDDQILLRVLDNIDQERNSVATDDDLLFSFRHRNFGSRIDDNSLLIQLFLDDIGVTNPIGSKKDSQKLTMVYFSLEDVPDGYRSKLHFIQLLAVCKSKSLKVTPSNENAVKQREVFFVEEVLMTEKKQV